jgi:hypothetical protein
MDFKFNNTWNLLFQKNYNDWTINGYDKLYDIKNIYDFWLIFNNINNDKNNIILINYPIFIMRNNHIPIWEHPSNINGSECSIKINIDHNNTIDDMIELFIKLSSNIMGETFIENNEEINGISVSNKYNKYYIIKLWLKSNKINNIELLPDYIKNKYDVLFNSYNDKYT